MKFSLTIQGIWKYYPVPYSLWEVLEMRYRPFEQKEASSSLSLDSSSSRHIESNSTGQPKSQFTFTRRVTVHILFGNTSKILIGAAINAEIGLVSTKTANRQFLSSMQIMIC